MKYKWLLIFFCLVTCSLAGQQEKTPVLINGVVMDATSQEPLANVHVLLGTTGGQVSGTDGRFSLFMYRGDTLKFTCLGYGDASFILADTLPGRSYVAGIFMDRDTIYAGEVIVFPRLGDLRTEIMINPARQSQQQVNAENNIRISTYQGLNSQANLGDPNTNYQLIKQKQIIDAYEKGGIPSDMMVGLNLVTFIPATIYLMTKGLPERPRPPKPYISPSEMDLMMEMYQKKKLRQKLP